MLNSPKGKRAVSSRKRNDCFVVRRVIERLWEEQLGGAFPAERLSGSGVEREGDGVALLMV